MVAVADPAGARVAVGAAPDGSAIILIAQQGGIQTTLTIRLSAVGGIIEAIERAARNARGAIVVPGAEQSFDLAEVLAAAPDAELRAELEAMAARQEQLATELERRADGGG
jgi:hypothetical protein